MCLLAIDGRGTVHRQYALFRHDVVHQREQGFLHFTGILGAQDDDLVGIQVQIDARLGRHTRRVAIRRKSSSIYYRAIGFAEIIQFRRRWPDQHVVHEECVVGTPAKHTNFDPVLGVPTSVSIDTIHALKRVQVVDCTLPIDGKTLLFQ